MFLCEMLRVCLCRARVSKHSDFSSSSLSSSSSRLVAAAQCPSPRHGVVGARRSSAAIELQREPTAPAAASSFPSSLSPQPRLSSAASSVAETLSRPPVVPTFWPAYLPRASSNLPELKKKRGKMAEMEKNERERNRVLRGRGTL